VRPIENSQCARSGRILLVAHRDLAISTLRCPLVSVSQRTIRCLGGSGQRQKAYGKASVPSCPLVQSSVPFDAAAAGPDNA
jgi:hypothetical protein